MVTDDGRWWLIEAKLVRNSESQPNFLFGNQLARYALAIEKLGVPKLHQRLASYLYGRRKALSPPESLSLRFENARDLADILATWCADGGACDAAAESARLLSMLEAQIAQRSLTLAGLVDVPGLRYDEWIRENQATRSLALLTVENEQPVLVCDGLARLRSPEEIEAPTLLPPFDHIPQSYKPTPRTLPRVLSEPAYALYRHVLEPRLEFWTDDAWPDVELSVVTSAAFSLDLRSVTGREICLQIGRSGVAEGGTAGNHPLKLIVNLIWAAEAVFDVRTTSFEEGERAYADLETLVTRLCTRSGMSVRGVSSGVHPWDPRWLPRVRAKMRGDAQRRPELVAVRLQGQREGYCWAEADRETDEPLLVDALDAVEAWLGPPPYTPMRRRETKRAVPGMIEKVPRVAT